MALFFGLEIVSLNQSLDFSSGESTISIELESCSEDQIFDPVPIGTPVFVDFGIGYSGILDRYTKDNNPNETYSIFITNGQHILDGCQLILDNYYGVSTVVDNLYNISGYLGFDSEFVSENGVRADALLQSILNLTQITEENDFGKPITYRGRNYYVEFENLPVISDSYRVGSDSLSLMDAVKEIFELHGLDFYIEFVTARDIPPIDGVFLDDGVTAGFDGKFIVKAIDRTQQIDINSIETYLATRDCVISKSVGFEVRKEAHSKFVVGADLEDLYFNYPQSNNNNVLENGVTQAQYGDDAILPYFGEYENGNLIIGYTPPNVSEYFFDIDITDIDHPNLGRVYTTSLGEIRAAKRNRNSWERFINEKSCNEFLIDESEFSFTDNTVYQQFLLPVLTTDWTQLASKTDSWITNGTSGAFTLIKILKFGYTNARTIYGKDFANTEYPFFNNGTILTSLTSVYNSRNCYYPSSGLTNPYFGRASLLNIFNGWCISYARMFEHDLQYRANNPNKLQESFRFAKIFDNFKKTLGSEHNKYETLVSGLKKGSLKEDILGGSTAEAVSQLYARIRDLSENYYNKKFMVRVPYTFNGEDPDTEETKFSQETTTSAYLNEEIWEEVQEIGLIPSFSSIEKITDDNRKFYPYVKFDNAFRIDVNTETIIDARYDLSEIGTGDKIVEYDPQKTVNKDVEFPSGFTLASGAQTAIADVWVKCQVDEEIKFFDKATSIGPRAVIELPNPATLPPKYDTKTQKGRKAIIAALDTAGRKYAFSELTDTEYNDMVGGALDKIGVDEGIFADGEELVYADIYAIPLKSNIYSYGPWYVAKSGVEFDNSDLDDITTTNIALGGKVEYVKDENLAPWNYNGFTNLDIAGLLVAENGTSNQPYQGTGSIEEDGLPVIRVGDKLAEGMPHITNVTVNEGVNGTTTTYDFQTWSDHRTLGAAKQYHIRRIQEQEEKIRDLRINFEQKIRNINKGFGNRLNTQSKFNDLDKYPKRFQNNTSYAIVSAEATTFGNKVVIQPTYNAASQALTEYENKAVMSLDGLLAPFSTKPHSILPSWSEIDASGDEPTAVELNPFDTGDPTDLISRHDSVPLSGMADRSADNIEGTPEVRGVGLRGPVIISGWGYDTNGKPVPSDPEDSGGETFHPDYRHDSSLWKSGPLDARWDENRGVWVTSGSSSSGSGDGDGNSSGSCGCCESTSNPDVELSDGTLTTRKRVLCEQLGDITETQDNGVLTITFPEPESMPLEKEEDTDLFFWEIPEENFSAVDVQGSGVELDGPTGAVSFIHNVEEAAYCGCPKMRFRIEWDALIPAPSGSEVQPTPSGSEEQST